MPSFKVACPSCETQVLIKSEKQIGTKTECPKCKYRFKVEAPGADAGAAAETGGKPAGKKNKKMLMGIGIGVVALAVLGGVGMMVLGGKGSTTKPPIKNPPPPVTQNPGDPPKKEDGKKEDGKKEKEAPRVSPSTIEATNLLPSGTTAVVRLNPTRMRESPLFFPLFEDRLQQLALANLGFEPSDVLAYYHATVGPERAPFGVVRLLHPRGRAEVLKALQADPAAKRVKLRDGRTFDYHLVPANPLLTAIGHTFPLKSLLGDLYKPSDVPVKEADAPGPLAAFVADEYTVVIADAGLIEGYLKGLQKNNYPAFTSETVTNQTYRGVKTELKKLLNALYDTEADNAPPVVVAAEYTADQVALDRLRPPLDDAAAVAKPVLKRVRLIGLNLTSLTNKEFVATARVVTDSGDGAREVGNTHLDPALRVGVPLLGPVLGGPVVYRKAGMDVAAEGGGAAAGGGPIAAAGGQPPRPPGEGRPRPMGERPPGPMAGVEPPPAEPQSFVELDVRGADSTVILTANLRWTDTAYRKTIEPRLSSAGNQVRGQLVVYAGNLAWQAVVQSGRTYAEKSQAKRFPQGALPRGGAGRYGVPHLPAYRVSFFAELLPYMGHDGLSRGLQRDLAWFDDTRKGGTGASNVSIAEAWVPELLVPYYPPSAWRATSPFAPGRVLGGTNFVGVAGIGRDAARLNPKDPVNGWKAGMTGYDWGSKPEEVTDGLANTIYLMQAPPRLPRPWLAGGGATVVGLDPKDPMADFAADHPDGKGSTRKGTYVLMGDMSVRWVPADIDPKVFLSMSTRAGGTKEQQELMLKEVNLDEAAPKAEPWRRGPDKTLTAPAPADKTKQ
jgi:hypothetical protein